MLQIYGIPNCNTVKKSLEWFKAHNIAFQFHDYKKQGVTEKQLEQWAEKLGYEALLNKKGTTWRTLDEEIQRKVTNQNEALKLMSNKPSVIKRPLVEYENGIVLGFDENIYQNIFK